MFIEDIIVKNKNGILSPYDGDKIIEAANKSALRVRGYDPEENFSGTLTDTECALILGEIERTLARRTQNVVRTSYLHTLVEQALLKHAPDVGNTYFMYHSSRQKEAEEYRKINARCDDLQAKGDVQNGNADSSLPSVQKCFYADYLSTSRYFNKFLTNTERKAIEDGYIYVQDSSARLLYAVNCSLFRIGYVLEHGCEINNVTYNRPKSLDVAFDVLGDITMIAASQQYGGFTIPRIDTILAPYAEMSFQTYLSKYKNLGLSEEIAVQTAEQDVEQDMRKGFQGLEIKFNTVASSRGDYPFITMTFGLGTTKWEKLASICALETRAGGQGTQGHKKPVVFPKMVLLYDKNLHGEGCVNEDVFQAGIKCSSIAMYPDWLSLSGQGYISEMYQKYGVTGAISPMGCRAFLSPWYQKGGATPLDDTDTPVFEGRFNIGAISLNLPMILAKSQMENLDFYNVLDYYLELIRQIHIRTYEYIGQMPANKHPLGFCYGGFYGGHLKPTDKIKPLLMSATASFGITALNELQRLYNGNSIYEDGLFALEVLKYINAKVAQFKKEDKHLYAIYGTPAESLCGTQVQQFRKKYGVVEHVSDRAYVSNSFHCHVSEPISPIQKQDSEYRFWEYCNGGKIQYCKYPLQYNIESIKTLVTRAMDMGFYEGVNLSLSYCDDCGYSSDTIGSTCPECGSVHITSIERMNGYLSYSRVGKYMDEEVIKSNNTLQSRLNPAKMEEIRDRVSM